MSFDNYEAAGTLRFFFGFPDFFSLPLLTTLFVYRNFEIEIQPNKRARKRTMHPCVQGRNHGWLNACPFDRVKRIWESVENVGSRNGFKRRVKKETGFSKKRSRSSRNRERNWKIAVKESRKACSFARNPQRNRPVEITVEVFAVPLVGKRCKLKERSNLKGLASLDDRRLRCEPST